MKVLFSVPLFFGALCAAQEPSISLEQAVRLALDRHEDIGKARANSDALKGKIREVKAQAYPDIQFVSNAMRWRDPSLLNASGLDKFPEELRAALVPSPVNIFDFAITVKQPLFTQGKIGTGLRLASIEAEGALSEIDRAQQDVALSTVKAFYDLLWAQRYRGLVSETQAQRKAHADMARTRYQNGVATEVEVLRSDVAVANGVPELLRATNAVKQARALLNYYIGRPLDSPTELAGDFQQLPQEQTDMADLEREAHRRRPELQRLRIAERSAATMLQLAKAESRMRLDFSGSYGMSARLPQNLVNSEFNRWTAGLNFTFPLFDGFKRDGLTTQAIAAQRSARLDREKLESQVHLAIRQAFDELNAASETVAAARTNVSQAERVLDMMRNNYKYGAATTLDILDSQAALSVARTDLLRGLHDYCIARAGLRWAIGQTPWE